MKTTREQRAELLKAEPPKTDERYIIWVRLRVDGKDQQEFAEIARWNGARWMTFATWYEANFITRYMLLSSHNTLPMLLADLESLEAENRGLREALEMLVEVGESEDMVITSGMIQKGRTALSRRREE